MNDSDDFIQVKRGRPKKFSEEARRRFQLSLKSSVSSNTRLFGDLQKIFLKESYSQKLRNMISAIPTIVNLPSKVLQMPLLNFFKDSVKLLMISEIELVAFSLILQKLDLNMTEISSEELINICFYLAKINFENNPEVLKGVKDSFLAQHRNFEADLEKFGPDIDLTVFELNKRYTELNHFMHTNINYSYYVDDIVRLSPPYQISDKSIKKNEVKLEITSRKQRPLELKIPEKLPEAFQDHPPCKNPDYFTLLPLDDHEDYLNFPDLPKKKSKHPFDFLNDPLPSPEEDEDLEMLLHFNP